MQINRQKVFQSKYFHDEYKAFNARCLISQMLNFLCAEHDSYWIDDVYGYFMSCAFSDIKLDWFCMCKQMTKAVITLLIVQN